MLLSHSTGDTSELCSRVKQSSAGLLQLQGQQRFLSSTYKQAYPHFAKACSTGFRADMLLSDTYRRWSPILACPPVTDCLGINYCHIRNQCLWRTLVVSSKYFHLFNLFFLFMDIRGLYSNATFPSGKRNQNPTVSARSSYVLVGVLYIFVTSVVAGASHQDKSLFGRRYKADGSHTCNPRSNAFDFLG